MLVFDHPAASHASPTRLTVADDLWPHEVHAQLLAECESLRGRRGRPRASSATTFRGMTSARTAPPACIVWRSSLGPTGSAFFAADAMQAALTEAAGDGLTWNVTRSCYLTYEQSGDHMALHTDARDCMVAVLYYLQVDAAGAPPPRLITYPSYTGGWPLPASREALGPAVPINLRTGRTVILEGSKVPHERPPLADGQRVIVAAGCYVRG